MLKKLFASIGIGSASVDAILTTEHFVQGGVVEGQIEVKGGDVEQEISRITLDLMTKAKRETDDGTDYVDHVVDSFIATDSFNLTPNEEKSLPFWFNLHPETPITVLEVKKNQCQVWLETRLDIDFAVDPTDRDYMHIHPTEVITDFIQAMTNNGFSMVKADVEIGTLNGHGFSSTSGCYQELEFKPQGFFGRVKEVELSFISEEHQTHVLIELDRRFSGDGYRSLTVPNNISYGAIEAELRTLLS